jgi:peroxiredoxin
MHKFITPFLLALAAAAVCNAHAAVTAQAPAPDFTLRSTEGRNLRLQEQRGQVVLINFWASWCGPCKQELPHLNRLHDKYRSAGFVMLGVNIDDDAKLGAATAARWGIKFPVLLDADKAVTRQYDLGAMPATVLVDRDGRVRYLHRGYREGTEEAYERQIRELVKE